MIHHPYGGSNAHIWLNCLASPLLSRLFRAREDGDRTAMERGNRIHDLAYQVLTGNPTDETAARDELDVAIAYARSIREHVTGSGVVAGYEQHLQAHNPIFGGTADAWIHRPGYLHVIDLKTGDRPVLANENPQLWFYAWLLIDFDERISFDPLSDELRLSIWQDGTLWTVTPTPDDVCLWLARFRKRSGELAEATPGEHCTRCPVLSRCASARDFIAPALAEACAERSPAQIAKDLPLAGVAAKWAEATKAEALALARQGHLPGFQVGQGRKLPAKWSSEANPATVARALGLSPHEVITTELLSPAKLSKLDKSNALSEHGLIVDGGRSDVVVPSDCQNVIDMPSI